MQRRLRSCVALIAALGAVLFFSGTQSEHVQYTLSGPFSIHSRAIQCSRIGFREKDTSPALYASLSRGWASNDLFQWGRGREKQTPKLSPLVFQVWFGICGLVPKDACPENTFCYPGENQTPKGRVESDGIVLSKLRRQLQQKDRDVSKLHSSQTKTSATESCFCRGAAAENTHLSLH